MGFKIAHLYGWCQEKLVSQKYRENDKLQLSPSVTPCVFNTYFLPTCYSAAIMPNIFTFLDNITSKCTLMILKFLLMVATKGQRSLT